MRQRQTIGALLWRLARLRAQSIGRKPAVLVAGAAACSLLVLAVWQPADLSGPNSSAQLEAATRPAGSSEPRVCADPLVLLSQLRLRQQASDRSVTGGNLSAVHEALDELLRTRLCSSPNTEPAALDGWLSSTLGLERYRPELRSLGPDGLLILWRQTGSEARGGGARATVLARSSAGWAKAGHIDFDDLSMPYVLTARADGLALLATFGTGNGAPPVRLLALAADRDRLLVHDWGTTLSRIELDASGAVLVHRRSKHLDPYPDEALLRSRVQVHRSGDRLVISERSLTPALLALDGFCDGHRDLARPQLLSPAPEPGQYPGRLTDTACGAIQQIRRHRAEVEVDLELEINWQRRMATVTLRPRDGQWRMVALR